MNRQPFSIWEKEEFYGEIDLLVIGAGIVGSSAALQWKAKNPDKNVIVVDKGMIPEGASTRNAGFACIGSMSEHLDDIKRTDTETVINRIERRWNGLKLLRKFLGDEHIGYEPCGGYEIFTDDQLYEESVAGISKMNALLKEKLGEEEIYSDTIFNGYRSIYNRLEGALHAGKMMRTLHHKLALSEIPIWWNSKVKKATGSRVVFESGLELKADKVLAATNGFSGLLTDLPVKPARGFVFVTRPIEDLKWKATFNFNKGYVYFRNVGDKLLIGGARDLDKETETTVEFGVNPIIKDWLIGFVNRVVKLPEGWKIEREWSGIMGFTDNKEPVVQKTDNGLWVAAGLSGMGVAIGMEVGRLAAEKMS